jgi:hypothetical protein
MRLSSEPHRSSHDLSHAADRRSRGDLDHVGRPLMGLSSREFDEPVYAEFARVLICSLISPEAAATRSR